MNDIYEKVLSKIDYINSNATLDDSEKVLVINDIILEFRKNQRFSERPSIKSIVADFYVMSPSIMDSVTRTESIRQARQVAMWAYYYYSSKSLSSIGLEFYNGKHVFDHATVLHATKKVDEVRSVDKRFQTELNHLIQHVEIYYTKYERKKLKDEKTRNVSNDEINVDCDFTTRGNKNVQTSVSCTID